MVNSCSPGGRWLCLWWRLFVLSFFPLDVLDGIWDVIEPVSEGFLTYSWNEFVHCEKSVSIVKR